jgi:tRNA-dihydrouridine synthase B
MGCPVRKVVKSEAGSALMKDEKLASKIIESVVKAVNVPVSLKMRIGWDHDHKNSREIAKIAEDSGIQMISVHGRTRSQLYSGKADWKYIGAIKDIIKTIPIIANGDIVDIDSARKCLYESGADGLMIGRGAFGSPWILKQIQDEMEVQVNPIEIAKKHLSYIKDFYENYHQSLIQSKKVLMSYCKGIRNASYFRNIIAKTSSIDDIMFILSEISC